MRKRSLTANPQSISKFIYSLTKSVDPKLLPDIPSVLPKKVDFLLEFNLKHDENRVFYDKFFERFPDVRLSPINDASSGPNLLACPIEVKPPTSDYMKAALQVGVVSIANLKQIKDHGECHFKVHMARRQAESGHLILPGLTVVGNVWSLHWSFYDKTGSSIVSSALAFINRSN